MFKRGVMLTHGEGLRLFSAQLSLRYFMTNVLCKRSVSEGCPFAFLQNDHRPQRS
jgi:hypothetical protein